LPEYRVVLFEHGVVIAGRFGVAEWFDLLDIISRVSPPRMIATVSVMKSPIGIACESVSPSGVKCPHPRPGSSTTKGVTLCRAESVLTPDFLSCIAGPSGLPEITADLLFTLQGLIEILNDLQQLIGILCF
jgi:hypothetical protein